MMYVWCVYVWWCMMYDVFMMYVDVCCMLMYDVWWCMMISDVCMMMYVRCIFLYWCMMFDVWLRMVDDDARMHVGMHDGGDDGRCMYYDERMVYICLMMYLARCMYDVWCVCALSYVWWCMMYDLWCLMYDVCMMYDVWWSMMYDVVG